MFKQVRSEPRELCAALDLTVLAGAVPYLACRTVCLVANELRDITTHQYFLDEATKHFRVKKVSKSNLPKDYGFPTIDIYEMRLLKPKAAKSAPTKEAKEDD